MNPTRSLITPVLILVLAGIAIHQYATTRFKDEAIDFYTLWSVPTAQRLNGHTLGSPYRAIMEYAEFLKEYVTHYPDDYRLLRATAFWHAQPDIRDFRMNNSPLLYTAFGIFPDRYSAAAELFRWTELGLFIVAILLLGSLFGIRCSHAIFVGVTLLLILFPVQRDLSIGNVNALLVFGLAALLTLHRILRHNLATGHPICSILLSSGIVLLVLFKPLVLVPCFLLALLFSYGMSRQDRAWGIGAGLACLLVGAVGPSWFFRSWTVWPDWFHAVTTDEGLLYPSRGQNCSLVMLLAERTETKPMFVTLAIGAFLILSLLIALSCRDRRFPAKPAGIQSVMGQARSVFSDAGLMVSIGIIFTLALSPLVWIHYYMLAVIPALWLCTPRARPRIGLLLAAIFVAASSEALISLVRLTHTLRWYFLAQTLSWIPLWVGILIAVGAPAQSPRAASEH